MLKNNRPYSNENGYIDDGLITDLPREIRERVLNWIAEKIRPIKSFNHRHTSYGIKHILQRDTGIYLTNNQFKDAMLICGYKPHNANRLNWQYAISEKSPAFKREKIVYGRRKRH